MGCGAQLGFEFFFGHAGLSSTQVLHIQTQNSSEFGEVVHIATGGNQAKCADLLGINRNTLRKKITDLDIQVTRRRKLM